MCVRNSLVCACRRSRVSPGQVDELVGYGLAGEKAPALATKASVHLEADEYHRMLTDTSTEG